MALSSDLISQFTKITNDSKRDTSGTTLRGTITKHDENLFVQLDGSDELTPISKTVEVAEGDRVEVTIANHSATVTGNLSDPSIGVVRAGNLESKIEQTAAEIRLEVADTAQELDSKITLTATEIRSEVSANVDNLIKSINSVDSDIRNDLGEDILAFNTDLANLDSAIRQELASNVAELNGAIEDVDTNIRKDFEVDVTDMNTRINKINLSVTDLDSKITQTATDIRAEVSAEVSDLNSTITDVESGIRNDLDTKTAELDSKITQTATSIRSEVSAEVSDINTTITNTETGIRNDLDIKTAELDSKITQTATSIKSEVSAEIDGIDGRVTELNTKVVQNSTSINTLVQNDSEFSKFKQTVEGFSFMGTGGTVQISGGDINLTGAITFSDLNQEVKDEMDATADLANQAINDAASANGTASSALDKANEALGDASDAMSRANAAYNYASSITIPGYLESSKITRTTIESPEITGNNISVYGTFQTKGIIDDNGTVDSTGYMGAARGKDSDGNDTYGVALARTWNSTSHEVSDSYVIVTNKGVRLQHGVNSVTVTEDGIHLTAPDNVIHLNTPGSGAAFYNGIELGTGGSVTAVWG